MRLHLSWKFVLLTAAVTTATAGALVAQFATLFQHTLDEQAVLRHSEAVARIARYAGRAHATSATESGAILTEMLQAVPGLWWAEVQDASGATIVRLTPYPAVKDLSEPELIETMPPSVQESVTVRIGQMNEDGPRLMYLKAPAIYAGAGDAPGEVRALVSMEGVVMRVAVFRQRAVATTGIVVGVGILLTWFVVGLVTGPVHQLVEASRGLASGDFDRRVEVATGDELADLAQAFNHMAETLKSSYLELELANQLLEQRVTERTSALEDANEDLARANTELRETQAQLIQAAKMAALGEFGAGVAHELNQPLAGIKGYAQLCLQLIDRDHPLRKRLEAIDEQATRMKNITETMWNLARQSKFEYGWVHIAGPVQDAFTLLNEQLRLANVEPVFRPPDDLPPVYGDANQLHQVFLNLFTNARDAIQSVNRPGVLIVRASETHDGRYVQVLVVDSGPGIPQNVIDSIFNPFFTTKDPGKGTGLGLSINYSIIQQHNGYLDVYSEEDRGTVFRILLPTEAARTCRYVEVNGEWTDALRNEAAPVCWRVLRRFRGPKFEEARRECAGCAYNLEKQPPPRTPLASELV